MYHDNGQTLKAAKAIGHGGSPHTHERNQKPTWRSTNSNAATATTVLIARIKRDQRHP